MHIRWKAAPFRISDR